MSKLRWILVFGLLGLIAAVYVPRNFVDLGGDSAQYIILAESLSHGTGYHAINYPDAPFYYHYPPVFPILLTPIVYFFGRNFFLMHILIVLCGCGALLVFFRLFKKYSNDTVAFSAMVLMAVSAPFGMYLLLYILSDAVFLLFMALAFLWFTDYLEKDNALNRQAFLTILFLNLAYFTRYAGLGVFLAVFVVLIFSATRLKGAKIITIALGVVIPIILWQIICHLLNPGSVNRYMQQFSVQASLKFILKAGDDALYYIVNIATGIFPYIFTVLGNIVGNIFSLFTGAVAIAGIIAIRRAGRRCPFLYYFFIYFALITIWPFGYGDNRETMRFILPLVPFLCFFIAYGFYDLRKNLPVRVYFLLLRTCFVVIIFSFVLSLRTLTPLRQDVGPNGRDFIKANLWIAQNGHEGAIVLSRKPSSSYFYSGHFAVVYPYSSDADKIWRSIIDNRVKYIVVDNIAEQTPRFLVPAIMAHKENIKPVYVAPRAAVFEVTAYPDLTQSGR